MTPSPNDRSFAAQTLHLLREHYPDAECALHHGSAWQLLCATILSAQCTDARVNMVTPSLFARYPTPEALASADPAEVEEIVKSTGFYRQKTRSLIQMSQDLVDLHGGEVPNDMEALTRLRGVGRKTANVIIGVAFGGSGVVVDTHVRRIARRLGWTVHTEPDKIEQDLMALFPPSEWTPLGHTLIYHGRNLCTARSPQCAECPVRERCPEGIQRLTGAPTPPSNARRGSARTTPKGD